MGCIYILTGLTLVCILFTGCCGSACWKEKILSARRTIDKEDKNSADDSAVISMNKSELKKKEKSEVLKYKQS